MRKHNVCTWNPNDPCFDRKRPCFGGLTLYLGMRVPPPSLATIASWVEEHPNVHPSISWKDKFRSLSGGIWISVFPGSVFLYIWIMIYLKCWSWRSFEQHISDLLFDDSNFRSALVFQRLVGNLLPSFHGISCGGSRVKLEKHWDNPKRWAPTIVIDGVIIPISGRK